MAEQPQKIIQADMPAGKPMGARKDSNLKSAFPNSPIYLEELTDEERKLAFKELVLDGKVLNGNGINSFDRDYSEAPVLEDVETGGGGLPASPYFPNLTSPGPGSINPSDQPVYNGNIPTAEEKQSAFGTGLGGTTSPNNTSEQMKNVASLGEYISGKSYQGSDGSV
jgi:hypothetical protein